MAATSYLAFSFGSVGLSLFASDLSYSRDVRPIIERQCQGCHQPNLKSSNLDLTSYEGFKTGGKHGSAAGTLITYLPGESKPQMPLGQPPLPAEQIDLVLSWIPAGAKDPTPPEARNDLAPSKPMAYSHRLG